MAVRRTAGLVAAVTGLGLAAGCDPGWEDPLPVRVAVRVDGGALEVWAGTPCEGVSRIDLVYQGGSDALEHSYVAEDVRTVERWRSDRPPRGFRRDRPGRAPAWQEWDSALVRVGTGDDVRSAPVDLAALRDGGGESADYLVGSEWLSEEEAAAGDGEDYLLLCSGDAGS